MYNDKFVSLVAGEIDKRPYSAPPCFELVGKRFSVDFIDRGLCELVVNEETLEFCGESFDYSCVKCKEDVYLLGFGGGCLVLDISSGAAVLIDGSGTFFSKTGNVGYTTDLEGWKCRACFRPGLELDFQLEEESIICGEDKRDVDYISVDDSLYIVSANTTDGIVTIVIDLARFLFYGSIADRLILGGYIENND